MNSRSAEGQEVSWEAYLRDPAYLHLNSEAGPYKPIHCGANLPAGGGYPTIRLDATGPTTRRHLPLSSLLEGAEDARIERLETLQVPADGAALFDFLLREIPDVVSQLPCVCCSEVLEGCYQGACPPS